MHLVLSHYHAASFMMMERKMMQSLKLLNPYEGPSWGHMDHPIRSNRPCIGSTLRDVQANTDRLCRKPWLSPQWGKMLGWNSQGKKYMRQTQVDGVKRSNQNTVNAINTKSYMIVTLRMAPIVSLPGPKLTRLFEPTINWFLVFIAVVN